jgi:chromosome segregation ATPase
LAIYLQVAKRGLIDLQGELALRSQELHDAQEQKSAEATARMEEYSRAETLARQLSQAQEDLAGVSDSLRRELHDEHHRRHHLVNELARSRIECDEATAAVERMIVETKTQAGLIDQLQTQITLANLRSEELQEEVAALQANTASMKAEESKWRCEKQQLHVGLKEARSQLKEVESVQGGLNIELDVLLKGIEDQVEMCWDNVRRMAERLLQESARSRSLESEASETQSECRRLQGEIRNLEDEFAREKRAQEVRTKEAHELREHLEEARAQLVDFAADASAQRDSAERARQEAITEGRQAIEEIQRCSEATAAEVAAQESEGIQQRLRLNLAVAEKEFYIQEIEKLRDELAVVKASESTRLEEAAVYVDSFRRELQDERDRRRQLVSELERRRTECVEATSNLERERGKTSHFDQMLSEQRRELEASLAVEVGARTEAARLQRELDSVHELLREISVREKTAQRELAKAKDMGHIALAAAAEDIERMRSEMEAKEAVARESLEEKTMLEALVAELQTVGERLRQEVARLDASLTAEEHKLVWAQEDQERDSALREAALDFSDCETGSTALLKSHSGTEPSQLANAASPVTEFSSRSVATAVSTRRTLQLANSLSSDQYVWYLIEIPNFAPQDAVLRDAALRDAASGAALERERDAVRAELEKAQAGLQEAEVKIAAQSKELRSAEIQISAMKKRLESIEQARQMAESVCEVRAITYF